MPYKFFEIHSMIMATPTDLLNRPIEIYNGFIRRAGTRIISSNFNKYGDNTNPNLQIRLNINNERTLVAALQRLSNTLENDNVIYPSTVVLRDWNEPPFVVTAHETATKCAATFKENINANQRTLNNMLNNCEEFMWKFMIAVLRGAGFRPQIIWGILRNPIEPEITALAGTCYPILQESFAVTEPTADYLERFVHCFFNCTLSHENRLLGSLQVSNVWQNLADSRVR